jgi:ribosome-binding factor A
MKEKREKRLNSEFKREIYEILTNKVKDARLTEMFSITSVNTTADLKQAKVYISIFSMNEERKQATFDAIKASAGFVRREISSRMHIRTVPEFTFLIDNRAEYGEKIDKIISEIHKNGSKDENA